MVWDILIERVKTIGCAKDANVIIFATNLHGDLNEFDCFTTKEKIALHDSMNLDYLNIDNYLKHSHAIEHRDVVVPMYQTRNIHNTGSATYQTFQETKVVPFLKVGYAYPYVYGKKLYCPCVVYENEGNCVSPKFVFEKIAKKLRPQTNVVVVVPTFLHNYSSSADIVDYTDVEDDVMSELSNRVRKVYTV